MSLDRFIYFTDKKPTFAELTMVAEDYVSGLGGTIEAQGSRLIVSLPGHCSHPLRRIVPDLISVHVFDEDPSPRWFEVFLHDEGTVDVITRSHDDLTNGIAERYASIIARWWNGNRDLF